MTSFTPVQFPADNVQVVSALVGRVVRYFNRNHSTVTNDGVRTFKIVSVDRVFFSSKENRRCVTVLAKDVDDHGEEKYRTLHLAGIATVV